MPRCPNTVMVAQVNGIEPGSLLPLILHDLFHKMHRGGPSIHAYAAGAPGGAYICIPILVRGATRCSARSRKQ